MVWLSTTRVSVQPTRTVQRLSAQPATEVRWSTHSAAATARGRTTVQPRHAYHAPAGVCLCVVHLPCGGLRKATKQPRHGATACPKSRRSQGKVRRYGFKATTKVASYHATRFARNGFEKAPPRHAPRTTRFTTHACDTFHTATAGCGALKNTTAVSCSARS